MSLADLTVLSVGVSQNWKCIGNPERWCRAWNNGLTNINRYQVELIIGVRFLSIFVKDKPLNEFYFAAVLHTNTISNSCSEGID